MNKHKGHHGGRYDDPHGTSANATATHYVRPDGTTRPKPTGNSTSEDWADYYAAADHYAKNKGKNKQQPFDPYLNTWA